MEFKHWLKEINEQHDAIYHDNMIVHARDIIELSMEKTSKEMCTILGLNAQQYAIAKRLLIAMLRSSNAREA